MPKRYKPVSMMTPEEHEKALERWNKEYHRYRNTHLEQERERSKLLTRKWRERLKERKAQENDGHADVSR